MLFSVLDTLIYLSPSAKLLVVWIPDTIRNISLKSFITEKNKYTPINTLRFYLKKPAHNDVTGYSIVTFNERKRI